jgi:hypothetical protein
MEAVTALPKKATSALNTYVVLLKNGKTLEVTAEIFDNLFAGEDYIPVLYRFYRSKRVIFEIEAGDVRMIADKNEVDVDQAITALKYKHYRRKKRNDQ